MKSQNKDTTILRIPQSKLQPVRRQVCENCGREGPTVVWVGDEGVLALSHGMYSHWCELCCAKSQLKHAEEVASHIPKLQAKLKRLERNA